VVAGRLRALVAVWMGDTSMSAVIRARELLVDGRGTSSGRSRAGYAEASSRASSDRTPRPRPPNGAAAGPIGLDARWCGALGFIPNVQRTQRPRAGPRGCSYPTTRAKVLPEARLAKAVVDRLTHRAHIIETGCARAPADPTSAVNATASSVRARRRGAA
jgi:hypothetical protein